MNRESYFYSFILLSYVSERSQMSLKPFKEVPIVYNQLWSLIHFEQMSTRQWEWTTCVPHLFPYLGLYSCIGRGAWPQGGAVHCSRKCQFLPRILLRFYIVASKKKTPRGVGMQLVCILSSPDHLGDEVGASSEQLFLLCQFSMRTADSKCRQHSYSATPSL